MKPEQPKPTPQEKLEERIIALVLGELPPKEAVRIRQKIDQNPKLAAFHNRIERTIGLVQEASLPLPIEDQPAETEDHRLPEVQRQALLNRFKTAAPKTPHPHPTPPAATSTTPPPRTTPHAPVRARILKFSWLVPVAVAASILVLLTPLLIRSFKGPAQDSLALHSSRSAATRASTEELFAESQSLWEADPEPLSDRYTSYNGNLTPTPETAARPSAYYLREEPEPGLPTGGASAGGGAPGESAALQPAPSRIYLPYAQRDDGVVTFESASTVTTQPVPALPEQKKHQPQGQFFAGETAQPRPDQWFDTDFGIVADRESQTLPTPPPTLPALQPPSDNTSAPTPAIAGTAGSQLDRLEDFKAPSTPPPPNPNFAKSLSEGFLAENLTRFRSGSTWDHSTAPEAAGVVRSDAPDGFRGGGLEPAPPSTPDASGPQSTSGFGRFGGAGGGGAPPPSAEARQAAAGDYFNSTVAPHPEFAEATRPIGQESLGSVIKTAEDLAKRNSSLGLDPGAEPGAQPDPFAQPRATIALGDTAQTLNFGNVVLDESMRLTASVPLPAGEPNLSLSLPQKPVKELVLGAPLTAYKTKGLQAQDKDAEMDVMQRLDTVEKLSELGSGLHAAESAGKSALIDPIQQLGRQLETLAKRPTARPGAQPLPVRPPPSRPTTQGITLPEETPPAPPERELKEKQSGIASSGNRGVEPGSAPEQHYAAIALSQEAEQERRSRSIRLPTTQLTGITTVQDESLIIAQTTVPPAAEPTPPTGPEPARDPQPNGRQQQVTPPVPNPEPKPEVITQTDPFSTFSLNVSDVAFQLAAASLANNTLPSKATLRSEEFLNAFNYHDPAPAPGAPLAFTWEQARSPFHHDRDLIRFSIQTAASGRQQNQPLNLVLLLDNSGSMERADRVRIVRVALDVLARQLTPADRISVVAFARTPRLWVDGLPGGQPDELTRQVGNLNPEGGTNLELALALAYATTQKHFMPQGNNRVILLTDGAANLGDVNPATLKDSVEAQRKKGIALDCFGIGWEGYNDDLLEVLSRNGDGRYGFINDPEAAARDFAGQLAGSLRVAASDVKAQVEFNPQRVTRHRQIGYEKHQLTREQFRDNTVDAAEIGAAEAGTALYSAQVNPNGLGPIGVVRVRFKVPATGLYQEVEWLLPYNPAVPTLDQAYPSMRLATVASTFAERLASSPYAANATFAHLQNLLQGVPETFPNDERPRQLATMIQQARRLSGE